MTKENFLKLGKRLSASALAVVLTLSTASVLPSFAQEESVDSTQLHATGLIPDSQEVIEEHLASDKQIYDLDFIQTDDPSTDDTLVGVCKAAKVASLPEKAELNHKYLPPVDSQGSIGSCASWATVYYMKSYQEAEEHDWDLSDGNKKHLFNPSFAFNQIGDGEYGSTESENFDILVNQGACPLYNMKCRIMKTQPKEKPNETQKDMASNYKGIKNSDTSKWHSVRGLDSIKAYLAKGQPVVVGMATSWDFHRLRKNDPVLYKPTIDREEWNELSASEREKCYIHDEEFHALCLVGYDENYNYNCETVPVLKFVNSWGKNWGENGYGYITEEAFKSFFRHYSSKEPQGYVLDDKSHNDTNDFFTSDIKSAVAKKDIRAYSSPDYFNASDNKDNFDYTIPKGTAVEIKKFVSCKESDQQPYLVTADGHYINAQKDSLAESVLEKNIIRGNKNNKVSNYSNSETSKVTITPNNNVKYNKHNTLKIDYTVNQSDSSNGYAGARINADSKINVNGAKGIEFKYMTPAGQSGNIALCLKGSIATKYFTLSATNGKWKTFRTSCTYKNADLYSVSLYVKGIVNGKKTDPASGTLNIAEMKMLYDLGTSYSFSVKGDKGATFEGIQTGKYKSGTQITVTANMDKFSTFLGWSTTKGGEIISTDPTYSLNLNKNTTLYANVERPTTYFCELKNCNSEGGSISELSENEFVEGTKIYAYAYPNISYKFIGWSETKDGSIISDNQYYNFELTKDTTLCAHFEKVDSKSVEVLCDTGCNSVYVQLNTGGSRPYVTTITKMDIPTGKRIDLFPSLKTGYKVVGWYDNPECTGTPLCTNESYSGIIVDKDMKIYLKTTNDSERCKLTVHGNTKQGEITSTLGFYDDNGNYYGETEKGTVITTTAKAKEGYKFIGWYDNAEFKGEPVETCEVNSFSLTKDTNLYARFEKQIYRKIEVVYDTEKSNVNLISSAVSQSKATKATVPDGTVVSLVASAKPGYELVGWYDNALFSGKPLSTSSSYNITMNKDMKIYLKVEAEKPEEYSFKVYHNPYMGSISGTVGNSQGMGNFGGTCVRGTSVTATATSHDGYRFTGWHKDSYTGELLSSNSSYTFNVDSDTAIYASFEKIPKYIYRVHFRTSEGMVDHSQGSMHIQGTISGECLEGTQITVTAKPNYYHRFIGWCKDSYDGEILSTDSTYTFTVNGETNIYAKFERKDESKILVKGISNEISSWTNANSGSYLNITSGSSDYLFYGDETLKLDYNINTNDQYGGYAGRTVSLESTYKNENLDGYNGIGFWYMTPSDFNGQIALCLQSNNIGLDDLVQLPATAGEWKYYFYETSKISISDLTLYINGSKNGYTTTASNGIAEGTLYMANIEVAKK